MILNSDMYVPALRWRQGEYQALLRLSAKAKERIMPLITIPEIEFDFEDWRPKKSVQEHVHPFPNRYRKKWGKRPAWVSVHNKIVDKAMADGRHIFTYVFDELREFEVSAIPAVAFAADEATIQAVGAILNSGSKGVAILVRIEDLMKPQLHSHLRKQVSALNARLSEADLIVDLAAPNFEPYEVFSKALIAAIAKLGDLNEFRNFVLIGTSMPKTFKDITPGGCAIPRHDWLFFQALTARLPGDMRRPCFGDYTIVHPEFTPLDMRKIKPAGKVVYTTPSSWFVQKGGAFRENREQMHDHCAAILRAGIFKGADYSSGDAYIAKCAIREEGPSNQTRWKEVAINHHITHVLDDLSMFVAAP